MRASRGRFRYLAEGPSAVHGSRNVSISDATLNFGRQHHRAWPANCASSLDPKALKTNRLGLEIAVPPEGISTYGIGLANGANHKTA